MLAEWSVQFDYFYTVLAEWSVQIDYFYTGGPNSPCAISIVGTLQVVYFFCVKSRSSQHWVDGARRL